MVVSHLPVSTLIAYIKHYDNLLYNGCKNPENVVHFLNECIDELKKKYDLYTKK